MITCLRRQRDSRNTSSRAQNSSRRTGVRSCIAATSLTNSSKFRNDNNDSSRRSPNDSSKPDDANSESPQPLSNSSQPSVAQLLLHRPIAVLSVIPRPVVLFAAGAVAGAIGKTITAPLDRVKILLQVRGGDYGGLVQAAAYKGQLVKSFLAIGQTEGLFGYWKGNLPQVLRVLPYSAMQLYTYELFKRLFQDKEGDLSMTARLAAGACAGMTSTLVTYPLDTLRLRLAIDPKLRGMGAATALLWKEGGAGAFFRGLGPAVVGIAPYMALELAAFDLLPAHLPPFARGFSAALIATTFCYPLDTIRRQVQMSSAAAQPIQTVVMDILRQDGVGGMYRGFIPNALKNLPNKGIRLSTFDAAKHVLRQADEAYQQELKAGQHAVVQAGGQVSTRDSSAASKQTLLAATHA